MALDIRKVLISESVDACCSKILTDSSIQVTTKTGLTKDQLIEEIKGYDGLVVRSATKVTSDIIQAGKKLKIIGRAGVGVDNIDCDAATRCGVLVINAPGGNTLSAAELTCGMIVSLSRHIPQACEALKKGVWDRKSYMGHELQGKTLAIIGLGRIGREVAHRMQAYGMKTIGFDPLVPADVSIEFGVESLSLEDIWPLADYITVHTPLIPQTKNLINADVFAKCRKGVKVVNCARGGIIDEDALVEALVSGACGGAGLDVYMQEPPTNHKLIKHPKVICTPHLGASTEEAQSRVAEEIAEQFVDLVSGKPAHGIVNSPAFSQSMFEVNTPWINACKNVGALTSALFSHGEKHVSLNLTMHGPDLARKEKLFSASVMIGVLKQLHGVEANFINAPTLAKERELEVTNVSVFPKLEEGDAPVSVLLTAKSKNGQHTVVVTVRGEDTLLCAVDGCAFPEPPRITNGLILCGGKSSSLMASKLLGAINNEGDVNNIAWTATFEEYRYCTINCNFDCDKMPSDLKEHLDFWAQLVV